jgi:hypothetical protein
MNTDNHYPYDCIGQVFNPFDIKPSFGSHIAPEPGSFPLAPAREKQSKVLIDHLVPGKRCHLGNTEFNFFIATRSQYFRKGLDIFPGPEQRICGASKDVERRATAGLKQTT